MAAFSFREAVSIMNFLNSNLRIRREIGVRRRRFCARMEVGELGTILVLSSACRTTGGTQMREAMAAETKYPNAGNGDPVVPIRQTILLVEDEDMVRGLMCEVLEREGYRVLACSNPAEGIEESQRHAGQIDLLLTDVVMPGMNGREMADRIHEIMPQLRVVFMSGYTQQALTQQGEVDPKFEYLQKPFTLKSLTQKLVTMLEKKATN